MSINGVEIPENFICPISQELMTHPVMCVGDGRTYEKSFIEAWFVDHDRSPMTGVVLASKNLVDNVDFKIVIDDWCCKNGIKLEDNDTKVKVVDAVLAWDAKLKKQDEDVKMAENKLDIQIKFNRKGNKVHVAIVPPDSKEPKPSLVVCVLDVSGSMATTTYLGEVDNGFTRLDLVKHAARTVIESLGSNDYLSLVKFSTGASTILQPIKMNPVGKQQAFAAVNRLNTEGQTDLWDGLYEGLKNIERFQLDCNKSILLLTDGEPYGNLDTNGILNAFDNYLVDKNLSCTVNTVGFGYSLDVNLLCELANRGNGTYLYIPDVSMMGTIFVNYLANTQVTLSNNVKVQVTDGKHNNLQQLPVLQQIRSLQYGQKRDFIVECLDNVTVQVTVDGELIEMLIKKDSVSTMSDVESLLETDRQSFINGVSQCLDAAYKKQPTNDKLDKLFTNLTNDEFKREIYSVTASEGQISKGLQVEYFQRWGKLYIPTAIRAHISQQRTNFKDPSIQHYGGDLFSSLVTKIDGLYSNLPAPKPSSVSNRTVFVSNMSSLNDSSGPCFDGNGLVQTTTGVKKVSDVKKGDYVLTSRGSAQVLCVTQFSSNDLLVKLDNGIIITPWHPIHVNGKWQFPADVSSERVLGKGITLYDFILDKGHDVNINGLRVITLGHDYKDDPVASHPFFGSDKVVQSLMKLPSWSTGKLNMQGTRLVRDSVSGLIVEVI